jgi:hypothetical protein
MNMVASNKGAWRAGMYPQARTVCLIIIVLLSLPADSVLANESAPAAGTPVQRFEHLYDTLLKKYWRPSVSIHGIKTTVFDYASMADDANSPNSLFAQIVSSLESVNPSKLNEPNQAKAFWINVYNFGAMRLVVEHYPVDSITSFKISLFKHPWSKDAVRINGQDYSLAGIEKDILLKRYDDPRIIFAVSCAALSCPDRTPRAFSGTHLNEQLDGMIRTFFANPGKGLLLDRKRRTVTLSWILEKDAYLFPKDKGGVLGFVMPYLAAETREWLKANPAQINYFEHDWTLNDLAQAE